MKTALLTIGSEITSGEITNTNAVWMSEQLEQSGFPVVAQLSVPDDSHLIQWALQVLSAECQLLFISGGLGPTSDDITRQELAKWCGVGLVFNDAEFSRLSALLGGRGVPVREGHKQQCYFQSAAELLLNSVGTASGFYVEGKSGQSVLGRSGSALISAGVKQGLQIFVLPGPPRELQPMWQNEVVPRLSQFPRELNFGTRRWILTGVPESEVAEVVETVMQGCDVVIGYRASKPTVRVKIRFRLNDVVAVDRMRELDAQLRKWLSFVV